MQPGQCVQVVSKGQMAEAGSGCASRKAEAADGHRAILPGVAIPYRHTASRVGFAQQRAGEGHASEWQAPSPGQRLPLGGGSGQGREGFPLILRARPC